MYRPAAKISDAEANALVGKLCRSDGGCLRAILWKRDREGTLASTLLLRKSSIRRMTKPGSAAR